jgi:hypothetical protein
MAIDFVSRTGAATAQSVEPVATEWTTGASEEWGVSAEGNAFSSMVPVPVCPL